MRVEGKSMILSRRNLMSLLAKLDGSPPRSRCTIIGGSEALGWTVVAEEDEVHYADRYPGEMHPQTEEALRHGYE